MNPIVNTATELAKIQEDIWAPYSQWQFFAACIVIVILITTAKKFIRQVKPKLLEAEWFQAFLTLCNILLGAAFAIPKGFLYGNTFFQRLLVGIIAGGLSHLAYHLLIKRLAGLFGTSEKELKDVVEGSSKPETVESEVSKAEPSK